MNYFRMFEDFYNQLYLEKINENVTHKQKYEGNGDDICKLEYINIIDKYGRKLKVDPNNIVDVVNKAIKKFEFKYPRLYVYLNTYKIMYIPVWPSYTNINTMAVDQHNNLWINMNFVYRECNMNSNNIFGILFHEMFHIFLKHSIRFNEKFDEKTQADLKRTGLFDTAFDKSNISMDLEINTSMVDDGIVDKDFFIKDVPGVYNPDYAGMTWEEIYDKYGDLEYKKYLEKRGIKLDKKEMEVLDAIEKASKTLKDSKSTDEEKAKASKQLQKTIDKLLGKKDREEDIQDVLEKISETSLGEIGDIKEKINEVIDDLYKNPSKMSDEQYKDLMDHIDEMAREMEKNASEISDTFDKDLDEVTKDIENMKKTLKESMEKMRNDKTMDKYDKREIRDKIKDSLEDVMLSDIGKEKKEKKRKERDEKREIEKKEELKTSHPLRKLIKVFKNLMHLGEDPYELICEKTYNIIKNIIDILEPLTEKKLSKINKDDTKYLKKHLNDLKDSLFTDLKKLLDNKTIIRKTEDDINRLLDITFKVVFDSLLIQLPNSDIDDESKIVSLNDSVIKLRIIGKILKTQKAWRASDEFWEGVKEVNDELSPLLQKEDFKSLLKKLYDIGVVNDKVVKTFSEEYKKLYSELIKEGKIK